MKRIIVFTLFVGVIGVAQDKQPAPPAFSTADRIALQTSEKTKADAQKQWNEANDQEITIIREWQALHPGWHIHFNPQGDPKNFTIEADISTPKPKVEEKR